MISNRVSVTTCALLLHSQTIDATNQLDLKHWTPKWVNIPVVRGAEFVKFTSRLNSVHRNSKNKPFLFQSVCFKWLFCLWRVRYDDYKTFPSSNKM